MADPVTLGGDRKTLSLGDGYSVRAPGLHGSVELMPRGQRRPTRRTRGGGPSIDPVEAALASELVREERQISMTLELPRPAAGRRRGRRTAGADDGAVELAVPDPGPDHGQFLLSVDGTGVLTWHLPLVGDGGAEPRARRGTGGGMRYRIPVSALPDGPATGARRRGLARAIGKKLLKVLVYPLVDPVIGAVGEFFARRWEEHKRPQALRSFAPDDYQLVEGRALEEADWRRLAEGRSLLFIHGTFSTAHGGFGGMSPAAFEDLYRHYEGRVFAFNHHTISRTPDENIVWLLSHLPAEVRLECDIVCHSRGGLVARTLAEKPSAFGLDTGRVTVPRVVLVGVPNNGTILAHPDHMVQMLDRTTSVLSLFPTGPVTETIEAIVAVVKVLSHGLLSGLDGIASMRPDGPFLARLNQGRPGDVQYYAIASNYEPNHDGLKALVKGVVADQIMDRVFEDVANDLVVPEPGVYGSNGSGLFPITEAHVLRVPPEAAVVHTAMFGSEEISGQLRVWLEA